MLFLFSIIAQSRESLAMERVERQIWVLFQYLWDSVFRKEAEPYKGAGPCRDRRQSDCQVKTRGRDKQTLHPPASAVSFSAFGNTQPVIPSSGFTDKPSKTNRSFIHSKLPSVTPLCARLCAGPKVPQTRAQPCAEDLREASQRKGHD